MKTGWRKVKFGDVVMNANFVERDPVSAGIERIVGLEHLDPDNLHIKRWNSPENGTSFTRKFVPGQTLFGKRRAYQRKVAFAEFEGICSGDILTFESKNPKLLLPELLPFICQTDSFFNHALGTSAGSLSPRTSWSALQDFEFPLPPLNEQKRIAEIVWAADEAAVSYKKARDHLVKAADTYTTEFFRRKWPKHSIGQLLDDIQYGSSHRITLKTNGTVPILRIPNVIGGKIVLDDLGWVNLTQAETSNYRLIAGDVLIVRTNGNPDYVGRTAIVSDVPTNCVYASYLIRLKADTTRILPTYLHAALSSSIMRRSLRHEIRSSAGNYNLNTKGIERQILPLPSLPEQEQFVRQFELFSNKVKKLNEHIAALDTLRNTITNNEIGVAYV